MQQRDGLRTTGRHLTPARQRAALLRWYDKTARVLPWRESGDPYHIWVSEIMLQQTRVETVIPYYERFIQRFPDTHTLAAASQDDVMQHWSGLGYYRRARMLHAGVREVVERYGGRVPEDADARRSLPGVGRYTAGAIGSIAFGKAEAVVDGNVARVLSRLHGIETPLGRAVTDRALWARAQELVDGPRPGDLNQALMELGARVCAPRSAACERCPVRRGCNARITDRVAQLPVPRKRRAPKRVDMVAVVATCRGRVALVRPVEAPPGDRAERRRADPLRGLFGGLFGLPTTTGHGRSRARAALAGAGVKARLARDPIGVLEHVLTHRRLHVELWTATAAKSESARLLELGSLDTVGTSTLTIRCVTRAAGRAQRQ